MRLGLSSHLNQLGPERSRRGQGPGRSNLQRAWSDSDRLWLVGRSPGWLRSLHDALSDVLQWLLFNFVFVSITEVILEEGRRRSWCRGPGGRSRGVVGFGIVSLGGVRGGVVLFFVIRLVGVAGVAGHVGELSLVAVRVYVAVLSADDAVGTSCFFFEGTVSRFVTESEASVVVYLERLNIFSQSIYITPK